MRGELRDVMELRADADRSTYRAMYTTRIGGSVHVLHVFQKKAHHGSATPKREIDTLRKRLVKVRQLHGARGSDSRRA